MYKRRIIYTLFFVIVFISCQDEKGLNIEYEKYVLDNGLEVILHIDRSDPIAALSVLYHVGSGREVPGRTGFAHLFEHLLFQKSQHIDQGDFFKKIYAAGGTLNGFTWSDGTGYFEVIPVNALEMAMWMESDRMGWLLSTVTDSALTNEKEIVQNEKRQRYDNRPYGLTDYVIDKLLYPENHPYNWQTIGELDDVGNATLQDVINFYKQWYGPNNATLVVAGDLDIDQTKKWIEKYFGEIKRGPQITDPEKQPVSLKEPKKFLVEDNFATSPEINMVFPTVELYHKDAYALNLLADLFSKGKRSPLYKEIVEIQKLAPSVEAVNREEEIAGYFRIRIRTFPDITLSDVEKAIFKAFEQFEDSSYNEANLNRYKAGIEREFYEGIETLVDRSFTLSKYNEFSGSPGYINQDINKYLNVTVDDVRRVYKKYIKDKPYILTSFVPKGRTDLAVSGSTVFPIIGENIDIAGLRESQKKSPDVKLPKQIPSIIDRSVEPEKGPLPPIKIPQIWTHTYSNGLKLYGITSKELPLVQFQLTLKGGMLLDPPGRIGVANLVAQSMMQGTRKKSPHELEEAIENLGSKISITSSKEIINIKVNCLNSKLKPTYQLFEEILLEPRWDGNEFPRLVESTVEQINRLKSNPESISYNVFIKLIFGHNILSNQNYGTIKNVRELSIENLKDYYFNNFSPAVSFISVAGKISKDEAIKIFTPLENKWPAKKIHFNDMDFPAPLSESKLYFVDIPESKQSHIKIGYLALPYNDEDFYPANVMNYQLGGSINGNLDQVLREEKGYTYRARSRFSGSTRSGFFMAYSSVRTNATADAVGIFKSEMSSYRKGISAEKLTFTKNALLQSKTRAFETLSSLITILNRIDQYHVPLDYISKQQDVIRNMDIERHRALAQQYINPDKMIYLVVGDAKTQLNTLNKIGLGEAILLDVNGEEVH